VSRTVITRSPADTAHAARLLARELRQGDVILLEGDLGAGKTTFVRGLAEALGIDPGEVTSPTFTLVQRYNGAALTLVHVDLYRLKPQEVDDLGLDEMVDEGCVLAIEWPDRLPRPLGPSRRVQIGYRGVSQRTIAIDDASA
jgi:tRNA threonylcarbamoyladenosine biosynthesis protein TsaE